MTRHVEYECKLNQHAQLLLTVSDEATKDLTQVHDKLDRKKLVENANEETLESFRQRHSEHHTKVEDLISDHVQDQTDYW